jgi:hypothetical protein
MFSYAVLQQTNGQSVALIARSTSGYWDILRTSKVEPTNTPYGPFGGDKNGWMMMETLYVIGPCSTLPEQAGFLSLYFEVASR